MLTPDYVLALVSEVNASLALDNADIGREINGVRQELADVERAIQNLLDLAERYGAEAAGARILGREAERDELVGRLRALKRRRELRTLQVDPEVVKAVLAEMRGTLEGDDLQAKRVLLRRFVERVEVSKESARLVYTFPIPDMVLSIAVPLGYGVEHCLEIDLVNATDECG